MAFLDWIKEHRIRHAIIAVVLVLSGLTSTFLAYGDWQAATGPLGTVETLDDGEFLWNMETDGRYILVLPSNFEPKVFDLKAGRWLKQQDLGIALEGWDGTFRDAVLLNDGVIVSPKGAFDLDTGQSRIFTPEETSMPLAVVGDTVYGSKDGRLISFGLWTSTGVFEVFPSFQAQYRGFARDPDQAPHVVAAVASGLLVSYDLPRDEINQTWPQRTEFWAFDGPTSIPWNQSTWEISSHGGKMFVVSLDGSRLQELGGPSEGFVAKRSWPLPLPPHANLQGVHVDGDRWVVSYTYFATRDFGHAQTTGFAFGTLKDGFEGRHEDPLTVFGMGWGVAAPGEGKIVFLEDGKIHVAQPGAMSLVWPSLAGVGMLLTLGGLAWAPLMRRRLRRTAGHGAKRCLHCGKRRKAGIAFCPNCGWRTDSEDLVAKPVMDPWDKDR